MTRERSRGSSNFVPIIIAGIVLAVAVIGFVIISKSNKGPEAPAGTDVATGVAFVQQQEAVDVEEVKTILRQQEKEKLLAEVDEKMSEVYEDTSKVWSLFEDYLLMGDSRAEGFTVYNFLLSANCIAAKGGGIRSHFEKHMDEIYDRAPQNLILCYGMNDVVATNIWATPDDYSAEIKEDLETIHEKLPNTRIYISSILVAREKKIKENAQWGKIPEYNVSLKAMCDTLDYVWYIDNSDICDEYADLWAADGCHVKSTFYPYWAINMIKTIYASELGITDLDDIESATSTSDSTGTTDSSGTDGTGTDSTGTTDSPDTAAATTT